MTDTNSRAFGTLSAKYPDESYVWRIHDRPDITAGKATGTWIKVCQQLCNKLFKTEIVNTSTNRTETSTEVRNAVSATLETGVELGAFSAGGSVTAETEKTTGTTMSQELSTSSMTGSETTVNLSREEMEDIDVFAVWQWVATTRLSNGNDIVLTTVQYTCTPDARMPRYLPGSRDDIQACRKNKRQDLTPVDTPQPVAPLPPVTAGRSLDPSGSFQHTPVQNEWHTGRITQEGSGYRWTNQAGASWMLAADFANNRLQTGTDNPYYQQGIRTFDLIVSNGTVNGFSFGGGVYMRITAQAPQAPAAGPVPSSAELKLQSDRLPMSRTDPAYTSYGLDLFPAIYLTVAMTDGSSDNGFDYKKANAGNVVFDDVSGDPYDLIKVVYWDVDANNPSLGKYAAQLTSTGRGVGTASLSVSFRNAPGVTASVPVTVVSNSN
ncbi:hypothetical protein [Jiella pelagia]|uniref:Uncharacterized protein n=1 Tax=Jiella pelagia TaxID=2986949 RepID=A0ABY7BWT5_9HYPH|nr:hypothetical protein [Jiella pelagia]WAP67090.1 hypothetical protein OH818_15880 [Jiella pelagia]